MRGDANTARWL